MSVPQFGRRLPGRDYPDRAAAFAIIAHEGRIACVRVTPKGGPTRMDLPGGGVDPGETAARAAMRECGEEAGLKVRVADEPLVRADHYFVNEEGRTNNTRGCFFQAAGVWEPGSELVPPHGQLKAVQWEEGRDVPLGEKAK